MVDYVIVYEGASSRPKLVKRFISESSETFDATIVFSNEEERASVSVEKIYEYLNALTAYITDCVALVSPLLPSEPVPVSGWPMSGPWGEVEWAKLEIFYWWEDAYYRDEEKPPEEEPPA